MRASVTWRWAWALVVFVALVGGRAWASPVEGQLRVMVQSTDGLPVARAAVELSGAPLIGGVQRRSTDAYGEVSFVVPPGTYRVAASHPSFGDATADGVRVHPGRTTIQTVSLAPRGGPVEVESTSTGQALTKEFLQRIPVGRTYQNAVQTTPGRGGNPNMGGGASNENSYRYDEPPPVDPGGARYQDLSRQMDQVIEVVPRTGPAGRPAPDAPPPPRLVHHHGTAHLRAPRPAQVIDAVAALASEAGGRVDHADGQSIQVRVPVARFGEVFGAVLALGDVLDQRVTADDVTDQVVAHELRVRVLERTLDRLVVLLARSKSETERLSLLDEIARVTEALDLARTNLRTLQDLAAMSRIGVVVAPNDGSRLARGAAPVGMEWLQRLSPFDRAVPPGSRPVPLAVPAGLVALSRTGPFRAESADGAALWTMEVPNEPLGSGRFWIDALRARIGEEFDGVEERAIGRWSCLAADEPDAEAPYHWMVCVVPAGRKLRVAQAFFRSPAQRERHGEAIDLVLAGGGT